MISINCIFCDEKQIIETPTESLEKCEGCTLDCCYCNRTMIIINGKLLDLNEFLKDGYKQMGLPIDENMDYSKNYIDIKGE